MQELPVTVNLTNTHMAADSDGGAKRERCPKHAAVRLP